MMFEITREIQRYNQLQAYKLECAIDPVDDTPFPHIELGEAYGMIREPHQQLNREGRDERPIYQRTWESRS